MLDLLEVRGNASGLQKAPVNTAFDAPRCSTRLRRRRRGRTYWSTQIGCVTPGAARLARGGGGAAWLQPLDLGRRGARPSTPLAFGSPALLYTFAAG